jgi:signal transduction histidine kinase
LAKTMVHVFSLRFLVRITGAGAHVLGWLGRLVAPGRHRVQAPAASPEPNGPGTAGPFRAATEKLATGAGAAPDAETAPRPGPVPTAAGQAATSFGCDPAPRAIAPAGPAGGKGLSTEEHAAFEAIATLLGGRIGSTAAPSVGTPANHGDGGTRGDSHAAAPVARQDQAILDLVPLGIVVVRDQVLIFVNRFLRDLLGVAGSGAGVAAGRLEGLAGLLSGASLGTEIVEVAGTCGTVVMIASAHRILWDGTPATLAVLRPSAESGWKRIEQELHDARRAAERASALKSDFLTKVSHEIRTPLNAILGFAEVMLDERFGPIENPRYTDYLKDIHASGTLVMSLVNDLLDLSKIEAGKLDLECAEVDANMIVAECVSIMQPQASRAGVVLRASLWAELPRVRADERSLRQIVLNLLSNAVKFNEPGGEVVIATELAASGEALLRVEDTGIGMSDPEIAIALAPFGRVAGTRPAIGTGLGLPLTKALVEANRARFSITSRKAEGTSIEIGFPPA